MVRVSRAIHVHRGPKELFRVFARALRQIVEFDLIGLFLYDKTTNTLVNPVLESDNIPDFAIPQTLPAEETSAPANR